MTRNPKIPAPRKFQKPTATRNITAQLSARVFDAIPARSELEEAPGLDGEERERDHLGGREHCAQRQVLRRLAGEVEVVHGADHPAERVQEDVEVNHRECDVLTHDAEQHEE